MVYSESLTEETPPTRYDLDPWIWNPKRSPNVFTTSFENALPREPFHRAPGW